GPLVPRLVIDAPHAPGLTDHRLAGQPPELGLGDRGLVEAVPDGPLAEPLQLVAVPQPHGARLGDPSPHRLHLHLILHPLLPPSRPGLRATNHRYEPGRHWGIRPRTP